MHRMSGGRGGVRHSLLQQHLCRRRLCWPLTVSSPTLVRSRHQPHRLLWNGGRRLATCSSSSSSARRTAPSVAGSWSNGVEGTSPCRRWNSNGGSEPIRTPGRGRFYIDVNIQPCAAPWERTKDDTKGIDAISTTSKEKASVASPISAGVDGTDSASGVARSDPSSDATSLKRLAPMIPLLPGSSTASVGLLSSAQKYNTNTSWHTVTLDGKALRTPLGRPLSLPTRFLAHAVAAEWNTVRETIQPGQMPLMTLSCTALDQVTAQPTAYEAQCLAYLANDTVCYWTDPTNDRVLYQRQQAAWRDLHQWIPTAFGGTPPGQAFGDAESLMQYKRGLGHPEALTQACAAWVQSLDAWHLTALHAACAEAKSFFVGAALLGKLEVDDKEDDSGATTTMYTTFFTVAQAQTAARVEEEFNISAWGLVEGQHDYDRLNSSVQLSSAAVLAHCLHCDDGDDIDVGLSTTDTNDSALSAQDVVTSATKSKESVLSDSNMTAKTFGTVTLKSFPVTAVMLEDETGLTPEALGLDDIPKDTTNYMSVYLAGGSAVTGLAGLYYLPPSINVSVCYIFSVILPVLSLGIGSLGPTILANEIAAERRMEQAVTERERFVRYQAAQLCCGHWCGVPVHYHDTNRHDPTDGGGGIARVEYLEEEAESKTTKDSTTEIPKSVRSSNDIAALSVVQMAGLVGEAMRWGNAVEATPDLDALDKVFRSSDLDTAEQQSLVFWGALTAARLLKDNLDTYQLVVDALDRKASVPECVVILENADFRMQA